MDTQSNMTSSVTKTQSVSCHDEVLPSFELAPLRALGALYKLARNPRDIAQGFTIVDSLAGEAPLRVLARFRSDPSGRKLLRERPNLLARLRDRRALERMPRGSLAHAYLDVLERGGITSDGLIEASAVGRSAVESKGDFIYVRERIRDSHDLWHAVTGYPADPVGEVSLLSFTVAQLRNPGIAAVLTLASLASFRQVAFSNRIGGAFAHGLRASWLPPTHWEALLAGPLADVQSSLGVQPTA